IFFTLFVLASSCKQFLEIGIPKNELTTKAVFSSDASAASAVSGAYARMSSFSTIMTGYTTLYGGLLADELNFFNSSENYVQFYRNEVESSNSFTKTIWANAYEQIYVTNAILEGMEASTSLTTTVKQQYRAEMLFMRALNYFILVNFFGDV